MGTEKNEQEKMVKKVKVEELRPGLRLARAIEYQFGSIIISKGTILDKYKIKRLKRMGLEETYVYKEKEEEIQENIEQVKNLEENYHQKVNQVSSFFDQVQDTEEINEADIKSLTSEISVFGEDKEMVDLLTRVRSADQYTYHHLLNTGILAYMFGKWLEFDEERRIQLGQAGLLHDIGKAQIPDKILHKPASLTENEYDQMKTHALYGYKMINELDFVSRETAEGVLTHHERYDGSGYPVGLEKKKIPIFGRILAIIDTFDALTSERVYQPSSSPFDAIKLFREETLGVFDFNLVEIFVNRIPDFFVEEKVVLNDGREAEVVFINPRHPDKPIIKVEDEYVDLYKQDDIKIEQLAKEIHQSAQDID